MKMKSRWCFGIAALLFLIGVWPSQGGVYDGWGSRMKIRVASYDKPETLTNFPTLAVLSTNIPNFRYTDFNSSSNGADLRFAASNETTELNYEIEKWDTNGNSYVWVQIPTIASTNDYFYAYWGNAVSAAPCTTNGATWDSSYSGVWHMQRTNATDSSTNGNTGTANGGVASASGEIGAGNSFDGTGYINVPATDLFKGSDDVTIEFWFNLPNVSLASYSDIMDYDHASAPSQNFVVQLFDGSSSFSWAINSLANNNDWGPWSLNSVFILPYSQWTHITLVKSGTSYRYYTNGGLLLSGACSAVIDKDVTRQLRFGGKVQSGAGFIKGTIDETRISHIARSSNYVYACWLNQASNTTFLAYSDVGPQSTALSVRANPATGIGTTSAMMNGTVVQTGNAENPTVYLCWGYTDGGTNSTSNWAHVESLGANWGPGQSFSTNITGLLLGSNYSYRCYVTNSTGIDWSDTAQSFATVSLPVSTNLGATHVTRVSATLSGQISSTGGEAPSSFFLYWADGSGTTNSVAMGLQSGLFSSPVSGLSVDTLFHYYVLASNSAGSALSGVTDFRTRSNTSHDWYVSSSGNNTYATNWASAISSIQEALNGAGSNDTIYLKGELSGFAQQLVWTNSYVSVMGGFEGSGTPGNRNSTTWPTILTRANSTTHRIFYISGVTNGSLTGVTVTNGYALSSGGAAHPLASGGGLYLSSCINFMMDDCHVMFNQGYDPTPNGDNIYGGGIFMEASSVTLTNCVISSNRVDSINTDNIQHGNGGGLALYNGTCWINNCFIVGNYAKGSPLHGQNKGGGLYLNGTATIKNTIIQANDSASSGYYTGMGDGVFLGTSANVFMENCLIAGNHGGDTGIAFWQAGGTLRLEKCTIATNKNYGIMCNGGTAAVTNCILWANGDDVYEATPGAVQLRYSIIQGGDSLGVNGCINSNPRFIDQVYFHEESSTASGQYAGGYFSGGSWGTGAQMSSAIDSGLPSGAYSTEPNPNGARVNMGAYGNTTVASKAYPITVTNRAVSAVGATFATLNGTLVHVGSSNVTVWIYYGLTDGLNVPGNWGTNVLVGVYNAPTVFSKAVTGLAAGSPYYYTCFVSNSAGATAWASPSITFTPTLSVPEVTTRGVLNETGPTATLQGEVTSTGGEDPIVYVCWGTLDGGIVLGSWANVVNLGVKTGTFSTDVSVVAGSNYFYTCLASNSAGAVWATPSQPFGSHRIRYVNGGATGTGTGYSWANAFTTIQAALDDGLSTKTNLIYVKGGTYGLISELVWASSYVTLQGGCEGSGMPGNIDAAQWPTVITNASGGVTRLLAISGVTDGRIDRVTLTSGNTGGNGGAISMQNATNMVVDTCVFLNNRTAVNGGAIYASGTENLTLQNCTLRGNMALNNGGGVNGGAIYASGVSGTMTNCVIERNAVSSTYGGGVWHNGGGVCIQGGAWTIRDCRISYNVASAPQTAGGGINLTGSATHSIKNCVFLQNESAIGDGIAVTGWNGPTLAVDNCTLVGNGGEGVYVFTGATTLRNSILWQNGDDINGAVTLINSDVQDGDNVGTNGCISANPSFERGVYLASGSPCIDAGSNTAVALGLDAYTTRTDGALDSGAVDIGYHAFTGLSVATADLYVSPSGSDANSGTNGAEAFKTITKALALAADGTRVHVAAGTYSTNTLETFPLSLTRVGLELLGGGRSITIIDASGSNQRAIDMVNNSNGKLEGVTACGGGKTTGFYAAGSGVYIANSFGDVVTDCIISNNWSGYPGAGVYVGNAVDVLLSGCEIVANTLDIVDRDQFRAGGGLLLYNSYGMVSNCMIRGNVARNILNSNSNTQPAGGGFSLVGGAWLIVRSVIAENQSKSMNGDYLSNYGGGFYVNSGAHEFLNCLIYSNRATSTSRATYADGGYIVGGTTRFLSCTVASNGAEGLRIGGGTVAITNSILWGNGVDLINAGTLTMSYCDVGNTAFGGGVNGFSLDPLFVDGIYFHLKSRNGNYVGGYFSGGTWSASPVDSPCIDAGVPSSSYSREPAYNGGRINLGAYGNTEVASGTGSGTIFMIR